MNIILEFWNDKPTFAILKHNNACGLATRNNIFDAYRSALEGDPISAFGGVLISNTNIDIKTSKLISELFFEVIIAPTYDMDALEVLKLKKNRIILKTKNLNFDKISSRSCLNGKLVQEKDFLTDSKEDLKYVTEKKPNDNLKLMIYCLLQKYVNIQNQIQ